VNPAALTPVDLRRPSGDSMDASVMRTRHERLQAFDQRYFDQRYY
jgi:hypothetical protein